MLEHGISFHLFKASLISLIRICSFQYTDFYLDILGCYYKWHYYLISVFSCSLVIYRHTINFCILTFYPDKALVNSLIIPRKLFL